MTVYNSNKLNSETVFENNKTDRSLYGPAIVKSLLIGLLLVFLNNLAVANTSLISLLATSESSFVLHLPVESQTSYQLVLKDIAGTVLHDEMIARGIEEKIFNLKNLPDGRYFLTLLFDNTTKWKGVEIQNGALKVEDKVKSITNPNVLLNGHHLDLNMLCFADEKVSVSIWDNSGSLLSQEYFEANGNIQRRYNLTELPIGEYQISVSLHQGPTDFEFEKLIRWTPKGS